MNYKEQFDQIVEFLGSYKNIWQNEILDLYPSHLNHFDREWTSELASLKDEDLYSVDCLGDHTPLTGSFKEFLKRIKELTKVEKVSIDNQRKYPDWAFHKVKFKKRYEIEVLAKLLKEVKDEVSFKTLVDIGGGVGHFARVAAHYESIPVTSLDINKEFQEIGQKRLKKYPLPKDAKDVKFINHDFTNKLDIKTTKEIFNENSFSLGLHTCGPLALAHIDVATKNKTKGFLNFGCCYNKLNPETDTNLSSHAKENGLKITAYSTTLAARGHHSMSFEDFKTKRRVKMYRYALHMILEKLNRLDIKSVGDCHVRVYSDDFASYALNRLEFKEVTHSFTKEELNYFFEKNIPILDSLFYVNIIRWQFGRVIELYLLLDRAIALEEKGLNPRLYQFFNEDLSPRNIGLLVK